MRGEYKRNCAGRKILTGSSPLARGILQCLHSLWHSTRIIPACAGNTHGTTLPCKCTEDHPRLRGEYAEILLNSLPKLGSSPLARGIHNWYSVDDDMRRIIPACAGNTVGSKALKESLEDHPRLRGEYWFIPVFNVRFVGSSPLARGILVSSSNLYSIRRIIPACAGNTNKKRAFLAL